jgi:hypothetical protein
MFLSIIQCMPNDDDSVEDEGQADGNGKPLEGEFSIAGVVLRRDPLVRL